MYLWLMCASVMNDIVKKKKKKFYTCTFDEIKKYDVSFCQDYFTCPFIQGRVKDLVLDFIFNHLNACHIWAFIFWLIQIILNA